MVRWGHELVNSSVVNEDGDLHMHGSWSPGIDLTTNTSPTFYLQSRPPGPQGYSRAFTDLHAGYIITPFSTAVIGYLQAARWAYDRWGELIWINYPLPGQLITVYRWSDKEDTWVYWDEGTTDTDGHFKVEKAFSYRSNFKVVYEGGIYNEEIYRGVYDFPTYGDPLAGY